MSDPIGPYAVTPSRPSPPSARCVCEWGKVYSSTVKAHRRTCPDWTQEDADWCAAQWVDAPRQKWPAGDLTAEQIRRALENAPLRVTVTNALPRSRWHRFRAWLAGKVMP